VTASAGILGGVVTKLNALISILPGPVIHLAGLKMTIHSKHLLQNLFC